MSDGRFGDIEPDELAGTLDELRALMTAIHAELIDVIAAFDEAQGYRVDGMPDTATWLAARANLSLATARREVAIATRAPAIPALMQAWRQGRLSWDQLQVLAPVATADTDTAAGAGAEAGVGAGAGAGAGAGLDAELAEQAPGWSYHSTVVKARALRPVSAKDALAQHRERFVQLIRRHDSTLRIRGQLSGEQAVIVEETLNRLADTLPEEGRLEQAEPVRRGARMADALVAMCEGHPEILAQNPARPLVVVHIAAERLADKGSSGTAETADTGHTSRPSVGPDGLHGPDGPAGTDPGGPGPVTIAGGWAIASATAQRLACDCRWQIVADDTTGRTIGISRESRRIPPWLARVVAQRDQHRCRWPKCDRTAWLEHHHIVHWAHDGLTNEDNLITMCWHHHHMLHEGQWNMTINSQTGEITLIKPDGQPYQPPTEPMSLSEPTRAWLAQLMSPPPHTEAA